MDLDTFIITVFCFVDDWLTGQPLRQRGPKPQLSDSEVLTLEVVGEFLGLETDTGIYAFFRRFYGEWFPPLRTIDRTTFARQAANLWVVKQGLWQHLLTQMAADPLVSVVDSFPLPVCQFARAKRCRRLREQAAFGYDELAKQTFYGLRAHLCLSWPGVITDFRLAPANLHDLEAAKDLLDRRQGWALGDRNYWSPSVTESLHQQGVWLIAPYKSAKRDKRPWPRWLVQTRRRIETVIGQLVERYHAKKIWARDAWHLLSRWLRKILSHTFAVYLCQQEGFVPLRFAELVTD